MFHGFGGLLVREFLLVVFADDASDVSAGLLIGGDAVVLLNSVWASVVRGESLLSVTIVLNKKLAEVSGTPLNVLSGIEAVTDPEFIGGLRHELHQALGTFLRDSVGVESALVMNYGVQEIGIDAGGLAGLSNVLGNRLTRFEFGG